MPAASGIGFASEFRNLNETKTVVEMYCKHECLLLPALVLHQNLYETEIVKWKSFAKTSICCFRHKFCGMTAQETNACTGTEKANRMICTGGIPDERVSQINTLLERAVEMRSCMLRFADGHTIQPTWNDARRAINTVR